MTHMLRHRGPDEFGFYQEDKIGLGHSRLSIIDLSGGAQPIHNEDKTAWIVFNGEIFNYVELREELIKRGHQFYTHSDTEVILHLYEEKPDDFISDLNGQFAFAIWDKRRKQLLLARDRVGIRPLFYTEINGALLFASEIKSIFMDKSVVRQLDPIGLQQLFTFWATIPPRTTFKDIRELPAGHYLIVKDSAITIKKYWQLNFSFTESHNAVYPEEYYSERLFDLLKDSIRLRLRADVPVAAYLSGGIDSSFISALVKKFFNNKLQTFSVSFSDKEYDEGDSQARMVQFLGTEHKNIECNYADIGRIMPEVIWHAEKPLIRTAPAPLFLLAELVRRNNIKVVLTGEGADEILAGYDLFREEKIRRFWAKNPGSKLRPLLMRKLYGYIPNWPRTASAFLEGFYRKHLLDTHLKYYSHLPRWDVTSRITSLFSGSMQSRLAGYSSIAEFEGTLPEDFTRWDSLSQAQYIEIATLLSGNLLSSQGDRMMMANSVEGRFPFLDYRVIEFCARLPRNLKLKVLQEKYLLKKIARPYLPEEICQRKKQAYRAPDSASFLNSGKLEYVDELLSEGNLKKTEYFDPAAVAQLIKKCRGLKSSLISTKDNMAVVSVITTMLLDKLFISDFDPCR
jgi:asparagine synthase (glutamine-hydrolysing)